MQRKIQIRRVCAAWIYGKSSGKHWYTSNLICASKLLAVTDEVHDECAVRGLLVSIAIATLP